MLQLMLPLMAQNQGVWEANEDGIMEGERGVGVRGRERWRVTSRRWDARAGVLRL